MTENKRYIYKRNGQSAVFNIDKIISAIGNSRKSIEFIQDAETNYQIINNILSELDVLHYSKEEIPTVEDIQDIVENSLIKFNEYKTAKAYILYRFEHKSSRDTYTKEGLSRYRKYIDFMDEYSDALNAASGSKYDPNSNVEVKNISTMAGEIFKKDTIMINRLLMYDKITELYDEDLAKEYIRQLEAHEIYKHDETSLLPYCVAITMYPFLLDGLTNLGGHSSPPKHLQSFLGSFINLIFIIASQFAGAVATPEFIMYMDYFVRKEYGDDYYLHDQYDTIIKDGFQQVVYSMNQPCAARSFQSVFWNVSYFDKNYFESMFGNFYFPDATKPQWESVDYLQRKFMTWFNDERKIKMLTFPVETMALLSDGKDDYLDKEYADLAAKMYADGHSFFTYVSDSADSLSSCCFDGDQMTLTKSSDGVNFMSFKELSEANYNDTKRNFTIFHNGSWMSGKAVKYDKRPMFKITTSNKKEIIITDNHINLTLQGEKEAKELTVDDYLLFNNLPLDTFPEVDRKLTYEQGFFVGMYLGDGSIRDSKPGINTPDVNLSINQEKYNNSIELLNKAMLQMDIDREFTYTKPYNNVVPLHMRNNVAVSFIREWVFGNYAYEKQLNMNCLLQSQEFRKGILDGYYLTDGGNSNRIYTSSKNLAFEMEALLTSLGLNSVIDKSDRTDEPVIIRGQTFNRNYPLYCIRWYDSKNKRSSGDVYIVRNNSVYFKITKIEPVDSNYNNVYCFEMKNKDEPYFTLPNGIITHNCRLKNEITENVFSFSLGAGGVATGSKSVMTINVNRMIQLADQKGLSIDEATRIQVKKIQKYQTAFNEIVKDKFKKRMLPVYDAGFISLDKQYLTIGLNGLVEAAESRGLKVSNNDEYIDFVESILKPIYEENKKAKTKDVMFNTEFVPAEGLGVKNAKWDREAGLSVSRDVYNSYFYVVEDENCNIIDKFILHGKQLTQYLDGGSALHMNLDEHLTEPQYRQLLNTAVKVGCNYFTFNIPNTICNECGYISKHKLDQCPSCGSENIDYATRIIGYLKRVSSFSLKRQEEEKRRFYA